MGNAHTYLLQMRMTEGHVNLGAFQVEIDLNGLELTDIDIKA